MLTSPFGFLSIDKPAGITSHDCVQEIRKIFKIKRVGHGGTLDPAVTGVLPIAVGNATRLLPYLKQEKEYRAIIQLGENRSTDDLEGEILSQQQWPNLEPNTLNEFLNKFRGTIFQKPPKFSSIHIQGERAYKKARKGELFTIPTREITINKLLLIDWVQELGQLEILVNCSPGTYIRSLARDLGEHLKCGGYLYKLRRTMSQGFNEKQSIALQKYDSNDLLINSSIINPINVLDHLSQIKIKTINELNRWRKGQQLILSEEIEQTIFNETKTLKLSKMQKYATVIDHQESIAGIAELISPNKIQPKVVFHADG